MYSFELYGSRHRVVGVNLTGVLDLDHVVGEHGERHQSDEAEHAIHFDGSQTLAETWEVLWHCHVDCAACPQRNRHFEVQ